MKKKHRKWCKENAPFSSERSGVPHGYSGWLIINKNGAVVKRYATEKIATAMIESWHKSAAEAMLEPEQEIHT